MDPCIRLRRVCIWFATSRCRRNRRRLVCSRVCFPPSTTNLSVSPLCFSGQGPNTGDDDPYTSPSIEMLCCPCNKTVGKVCLLQAMSADAQLEKQPKCFWCTSILFRTTLHKRTQDYLGEKTPADSLAQRELRGRMDCWTANFVLTVLNFILNLSFLVENPGILLRAMVFSIARLLTLWAVLLCIFFCRPPVGKDGIGDDVLNVIFASDENRKGVYWNHITWLRKLQSPMMIRVLKLLWSALVADAISWAIYLVMTVGYGLGYEM